MSLQVGFEGPVVRGGLHPCRRALPTHADKASAVLKDASGKEVGKAELTDTPSGVLIRLDLTGIPPGDHAFHVHAVGKCDAPDFKSAGPHFNPDETKHGLMNDQGPHAGDMPNLHVPESGKLVVEVLNDIGEPRRRARAAR